MKQHLVPPRRVLVAALLMLAIGSAALSRSQPPDHRDAQVATAVDIRTPMPTAVMSTLRRACFDCHSEETRWPWYARLPVASHLIERDVTEGRGQLNWSHWAEYNPFDRADLLDKVCDRASTGTMPLWKYRVLHPDARLSAADITELCTWSHTEATHLVNGGS
jgi:heme-binding protein